jgi:hypothetical protein
MNGGEWDVGVLGHSSFFSSFFFVRLIRWLCTTQRATECKKAAVPLRKLHPFMDAPERDVPAS